MTALARVRVSTLSGGTVTSTIHRGPWEGMTQAYTALMVWLETSGYAP